MRAIAFVVMLVVAADGLCQTPVKEPDTLQSLLVEVHQLRQAIEAMTVASQRVQIALYALQMQDSAVARATQRLDNARNKCAGVETNRQHIAAEIQRLETSLGSGALPDTQAKNTEARLAELKGILEGQTSDAQTCQMAEAEATTQVRNDQAKLGELQDRIDRLDKSLERLGSGGK